MAAEPIIAALTQIGRNRIADMTVSGRGFQVESFVVGNGGHDPGDPNVVLSPNPTVTTLPQQTFGPKLLVQNNPPFTGILISNFCPMFTALLDYPEANGEISNIGLIARIVYSPILNDPLLNSTFLFAVGNRALLIKTDNDQLMINITLQT